MAGVYHIQVGVAPPTLVEFLPLTPLPVRRTALHYIGVQVFALCPVLSPACIFPFYATRQKYMS